MPLRQRFETLLLFDPNRSPATANVWISHPSPSEEQALGKIVVVSTITGKDRINQDIINLIQEELRSSYYQTTDTKPERAFEQSLHQTNKRLHHVITDGVGTWVNQASILVAVVWRETIILSTVGTIHAFLLRRTVRDGRASFGIHNILGSDTTTINPVRIFPHTVSGQLQADDQILFCTPSLLDYFSLEKLRRTMADGRPDEAVRHWETTLLGVEQRSAFAAVVIQTQAFDAVAVPPLRPTVQSTLIHSAPQVSMDHLIAKEEATKRLLSPSIWPAVRDSISLLGHGVSNFVRRTVLRKPPRRVLQSGTLRPTSALATTSSSWSTVRRAVSGFIASLLSITRSLFPKRIVTQGVSPTMNLSPTLKRHWRPSLAGSVIWWQKLSRRQQVLGIISVVLVVVIAVSVYPHPSNSPTNSTSTASTSISEELAKAKAALLYGGDEAATQSLATARELYNQLPNRSSKDKSARTSVLSAITEVAAQLSKTTTVTNPIIVAQLAATAPSAAPQQMYVLGTTFVAHDPTKSTTLVGSTTNDSSPTVIPNGLDTGTALTGVVTGTSTIIFSTDRRGFVELDVSKETWKPIDSSWPTSQPRIQSLATYQNRLYVLNNADNTIVRFARSANSFGAGVNWLKESASLANGRTLAVDGSIYILQPGGQVEAYANGRRSTFTLASVEPALTDATRLWTDATSTKLYLLDPSRQRLLVFSKTGKLLNQYTSSSWAQMQDFAIVEKTKTAYILSGTTITSFTLLQ